MFVQNSLGDSCASPLFFGLLHIRTMKSVNSASINVIGNLFVCMLKESLKVHSHEECTNFLQAED